MAISAGKYATEVALGRVFLGSTPAAGTTFPLSTGTAMTFGLWNTSATKYAIPLFLNAGFTSGTVALGEIGFTNVTAGNQVATGSNITAFTNATATNALLGLGSSSAMRFTASAATIVAASACLWTGISFASASAINANCRAEFDGSMILAPGQAIFVVGSIAQTALFSMTLAWSEVDISN